jgi:hypothetical protein
MTFSIVDQPSALIGEIAVDLAQRLPQPARTVDASLPSMLEISPPVTRLITFLMSPDPVKVAVWPMAMPNFSKLWNKLSPRRAPRSAPILISPPLRLTLGPTVPSVTILAPGPGQQRPAALRAAAGQSSVSGPHLPPEV